MLALKKYDFNSELNNGIDLVLPKTESKAATKPLSIEVGKNGDCVINNRTITKDSLELKIIRFIAEGDHDAVTIRMNEDVEMRHVVFVMDIANRNKIKSTLAVNSQ